MDYNNGKIYVIRNHCNDMVYVGSTTQSLSKRFSCHKCNCKRLKYKLYDAMNELDIMNFYIELVEEYPCDNREQLCAREGYYIREFDSYNNGYNGVLAGRSRREYYEDNREKIKEYVGQYQINNKEKIKKQVKQYHEDNKDKINDYIKEYREENKDKIKKKMKEYREENKDKIREQRNKRFNCECGSVVRYDGKSKHVKTKKHLEYCEGL